MSQLKRVLGAVEQWIRYVGLGLVLLGIVACAAPLLSGLTIAVVVGLVLLAAGALLALFGMRARASGKGNFILVSGALAAICGLVLVVQPTAGLAVVRWILIPYLLSSGASEVALAFRLRPDDGWLATLGSAGVSLAAALALWCDWPISGARAIGLMVGGKLIASGGALMRVHRSITTAGEKLRAVTDALTRRSLS